jgi:hypothetical protein
VTFLLDLWADLQSRGLERAGIAAPDQESPTESPAEARARRWFAALPATTTHELVAEARRTRHAGQRRRCLLALAARGDPSATGYLLDLVHGPRFEESLLAAHALGRCPATEVGARLRTELRGCRRPDHLLAALASARSAGIEAWLRGLGLSDEEKRFLIAGSFNLDQFAIAAALFRNRHERSVF